MVQYQSDELGRLSSANGKVGGVQQWKMDYSFDGFGNLYKKAGTGQASGASFDYSSALPTLPFNNQLFASDANGNSIYEGVYDFENRMTRRYSYGDFQFYAPDNKRIMRMSADGTNKKLFFYVGNERLATCSLLQRYNQFPPYQLQDVVDCTDELWFAGRRVGVVDRLGSDISTRMLPYGEEIGTTASDKVKFATYYRDEGGLDYADQRWYHSASGRFTTADPYMASGGPADPGSWNRYAYVGGDPVNFGDPRGLEPAGIEGADDSICWLNGVGLPVSACFGYLNPPETKEGKSPDNPATTLYPGFDLAFALLGSEKCAGAVGGGFPYVGKYLQNQLQRAVVFEDVSLSAPNSADDPCSRWWI